MRRRTFDAIATFTGLAIAAVMILAGVLLTWGHSFVTSEVHTQLAAQKIVFPAKSSPEITSLPKADATAMSQYAGQQMTTGAQAEVWANHFIAVHLVKIGGGQTYSQLSGKALADPKNTALAAQVETVFRGETLRGLLLNAYGFWKIGQIMLIAEFVAFGAAALMLILSAFGLAHLRRVAPEAEILPKLAKGVRVQTA
ncbi:MAG TPA: hypothetical protein VN695_15980 [Streptosporangiaceae bacterium]|nr:hypothetical protein [Streptosporangiaceae bacterium]